MGALRVGTCVQAGIDMAGTLMRVSMSVQNNLEVMGWKDVTMLRRYTSTVGTELAQG